MITSPPLFDAAVNVEQDVMNTTWTKCHSEPSNITSRRLLSLL